MHMDPKNSMLFKILLTYSPKTAIEFSGNGCKEIESFAMMSNPHHEHFNLQGIVLALNLYCSLLLYHFDLFLAFFEFYY